MSQANKYKTPFDEEGISLAVSEDIPQIAAMAMATYKEVEMSQINTPNLGQIIEVLTNAVINNSVVVERNKDNPHILDGVVVLSIDGAWWSTDLVLNQLFFYVTPSKRKGLVFSRLLQQTKDYGRIVGLPVVQSITGDRFPAKGRILQRNGFSQIGESYIYKN